LLVHQLLLEVLPVAHKGAQFADLSLHLQVGFHEALDLDVLFNTAVMELVPLLLELSELVTQLHGKLLVLSSQLCRVVLQVFYLLGKLGPGLLLLEHALLQLVPLSL